MHWELLDRYLTGECTRAELERVERWLAEVPTRRKLLEQLAAPGTTDTASVRARKAGIWARLEQELSPGLKLGGDD